MTILMLAQAVDSTRGPDGFIADWVRVMARKVDRLVVLTYYYNRRERLPKNVTVKLIKGGNPISRNLYLFRNTLKLSRNSDVVFAHILEVFGITAGIVGKLTGRKSFLWYCQGYDLSRHWPAKLALFLVDEILTPTEEIRKRYAREVGSWVKGKTTLVGHGIYLPHYD